ncbi:MAG: hypothetical protein GX341_09980 [Firmicutes bacterium]|jgi:hypothetical protein|nr:hypothetical protein [Bacillota bacterium]
MMREIYMLLGGLIAWVSLVWLRALDYPVSLQVKNTRSWRIRRLAGCLMSFIGILLALYGAWQ